jgi:RHS repeat-associated protein
LRGYGRERVTTDTCDSAYKFTGKERDSESGLDDFGARFYSSQYGRFMIPDWEAKATAVPYADLTDPQTLNLYGYVRDNPLAKADIDGHDGCQGLPGSCGNSTGEGSTAQQTIIAEANRKAQKQNTQEHQQYQQDLKKHDQQMAEKMNPTATDADRMKAASDGAKMADAGVKAGLAVAGVEASVVVGTAVGVSATVLTASQTVGAAAETYIAPTASAAAGTYVSGVSTVQDFVKGGNDDKSRINSPDPGRSSGSCG